jgi:hypothetical protein
MREKNRIVYRNGSARTRSFFSEKYGPGHRVGRVLSFFSSRRHWDSPTPSPAGEYAPSFVFRGGAHSLAGEEVGRVPIPTRGQTLWLHSCYIIRQGYLPPFISALKGIKFLFAKEDIATAAKYKKIHKINRGGLFNYSIFMSILSGATVLTRTEIFDLPRSSLFRSWCSRWGSCAAAPSSTTTCRAWPRRRS